MGMRAPHGWAVGISPVSHSRIVGKVGHARTSLSWACFTYPRSPGLAARVHLNPCPTYVSQETSAFSLPGVRARPVFWKFKRVLGYCVLFIAHLDLFPVYYVGNPRAGL